MSSTPVPSSSSSGRAGCEQIYYPDITPPAFGIVIINQDIDRADEQLSSIPKERGMKPEDAKRYMDPMKSAIRKMHEITGRMVKEGCSFSSIHKVIKGEISVLRDNVEYAAILLGYPKLRDETAKKTASFGERLNSSEFTKKQAEKEATRSIKSLVGVNILPPHVEVVDADVVMAEIASGSARTIGRVVQVAAEGLSTAIGKAGKAVASATRAREILGAVNRLPPLTEAVNATPTTLITTDLKRTRESPFGPAATPLTEAVNTASVTVIANDQQRERKRARLASPLSHGDPQKEHSVIAELLHNASETLGATHAVGAHLPKKIKFLGHAAGALGDILNNPTSPIAETLVCDTGVGLLKEAVDVGAAATAAISLAAELPLAAPFAALATFKVMQKVTKPAAEGVKRMCHHSFEQLREMMEDAH